MCRSSDVGLEILRGVVMVRADVDRIDDAVAVGVLS